jgi:UPF0716 protein FxsA
LFGRLVLLFVLVPLVELVLLLQLAEAITWWRTLAIVLATGVVGAWLARHEGFRVVRRIQEELAAGRMPAGAMVEGVLVLVSGALLITPGILTDLCGFLLLVPPLRRVVARRLMGAFRSRVVVIHGSDAQGRPFVDVPSDAYDVREDEEAAASRAFLRGDDGSGHEPPARHHPPGGHG